MHETNLVDNTVRKCIRKLRGSHGFKRFLRDGQYTDLEVRGEQFYQATEIKVSADRRRDEVWTTVCLQKFDNNECQWPMFFALMAIDGRGLATNSERARFVILGIFKNDQTQVDKYLQMLNPLLRRTTEGKAECFRTTLMVFCATSSYVTKPVSVLSISHRLALFSFLIHEHTHM